MAEPPPSNSPAGAHLSQFMYNTRRMRKLPQVRKHAPNVEFCQKTMSSAARVRVCITAVEIVSGKTGWTIHKPDCLSAQGKLVPKSVLQKARNAQTEKDERKAELEAQKQEDLNNDFVERYEKFVHESPDLCDSDSWAHCCRGKRFRVHVPTMNANNMIELSAMHDAKLKKVQTLSLGMYPDGIDDTMYGFRGLELENLDNKARIIVLFERLFEGERGQRCWMWLAY